MTEFKEKVSASLAKRMKVSRPNITNANNIIINLTDIIIVLSYFPNE